MTGSGPGPSRQRLQRRNRRDRSRNFLGVAVLPDQEMTKLCRDFERTLFSWSLQGFPQWVGVALRRAMIPARPSGSAKVSYAPLRRL
jgi:hypothetical protein